MFMAGARATAAIGFYAPVRYRAPSNGNGG
jgi:hypothetical protein